MEPADDPLLLDIEVFLARSGMAATRFGLEALNDPGFVAALRAGRDCRRSTRERVERFLRARAADTDAAA